MIYHTTRGPTYDPGSAYGTFDDLRDAVTRAVRVIEPRMDEFDIIAVQGASGMSIGFPVALSIGARIVVVRKPGEDNHCGPEKITGLGTDGGGLRGQRVLWMDDFVSMGTTRQRVREAVETEGGVLVAQYTARENDMVKL